MPSDPPVTPALQSQATAYTNQGGLLGAFTYALVVLETDDESLAASSASIPTNLFVTSALHDDAIDEVEDDIDRKRRLNERVTLGDLVYTNVLEATRALPADADLAPVLETIREIGHGQLAEEAHDPATVTREAAADRVDARGAVWGRLAVALIEAVADYSDTQLELCRRLTSDAMFVLTVADDVADLPEDVANGVANLPAALCDADLEAAPSPDAVVDAFLASDAPARLESLVAERRASMAADAVAFAESLDHPERRVLAAVRQALSWYCESVCSVPLEVTVPPARQRELRTRLGADEETKRRTIATTITDWPVDPATLAVDVDAIVDAAVAQPGAPLADVLVMSTHVATVADAGMSTSLADAYTALAASATT